MILIANIGNRDIFYKDLKISLENFREKSQTLENNYENEKVWLSYPILFPYFETDKYDFNFEKIYLFVTNQEDELHKQTDTLYCGRIVEKLIKEKVIVDTRVLEYVNDPTNYEQIFSYFSSFFGQNKVMFEKSDRIIVSLSGGTPQMNGALYVILSSMFNKKAEFYNVDRGVLKPINAEKTVVKEFIKKSCLELLELFEYNSIVEILEKNRVDNRDSIVSLLNYAHSRKSFNFKRANQYLEEFLNLIPTSEKLRYQFLNLEELFKLHESSKEKKIRANPIALIKELFWNLQLCFKSQNYLLLVALLFRLEEAILLEIVIFLFKDKFTGDLREQKNHSKFVSFIEKSEPEMWSKLNNAKYREEPLNLERKELSRPLMFYLTIYKVKKLEKLRVFYAPIDNILQILDKINKYSYNHYGEEERKKWYSKPTSLKCLGNLRNKSIIAHGFKSVSKEKVEKLYGNPLNELIDKLGNTLRSLLILLSVDKNFRFENVFERINNHAINFIIKL